MKPNLANLVLAKNGSFSIIQMTPPDAGTSLTESRTAVGLSRRGSALSLGPGVGSGPPGLWVHYLETRAAYGIAAAGETWGASGPFSGCHLLVGKTNGRVFLAHLAKQSGSTADADWAGRGFRAEVWARFAVPLPSYDFYCSSVVFVDWSRGESAGSISAIRVDIKTVAMGGFDQAPMQVFNVEKIA